MSPALLLLLALGCPACRQGAGPAQLDAPEEGAEAPRSSGRVVGGEFRDVRLALRVPVPDGWTAEPGLDASALRVRITDSQTGTRVEVWAFPELGDRPRPRSDCEWTFIDRAAYRAPGLGEAATTASCTPRAVGAPRIFAWLLPASAGSQGTRSPAPSVGQDFGYQVEIHVPPARLVDGRRRGEELMRGIQR